MFSPYSSSHFGTICVYDDNHGHFSRLFRHLRLSHVTLTVAVPTTVMTSHRFATCFHAISALKIFTANIDFLPVQSKVLPVKHSSNTLNLAPRRTRQVLSFNISRLCRCKLPEKHLVCTDVFSKLESNNLTFLQFQALRPFARLVPDSGGWFALLLMEVKNEHRRVQGSSSY